MSLMHLVMPKEKKKGAIGPNQKKVLKYGDKLKKIVEEMDFNPTKHSKSLSGSGLKILTPQQMLAHLRISSAQLQAGNNSQKLKNEIRQLLYSLYRSKKINKLIYKHLIATI